MMAEESVTPEAAPERESEAFSEALPLYLQEIGRVPLLTGAAEVELAKAIEAGGEAAILLGDGQDRSAEDREAAARRRRPWARCAPAPGRVQPAAGRQRRPALHESRYPAGRPDPGRQHRPDAGGREVRLPPRASSSAPTRPGGFARRSAARIADHAARSAFRSTWSRRSTSSSAMLGALQQELGREPTVEEIGDGDGDDARAGARDHPKSAAADVAGDAGRRRSRTATLGDFIEDEDAPDLDDAASRHDARGAGRGRARHRSARASGASSSCASAWKATGCTRSSEIGDEFGVTRERIRQIEAKALRKLRHPSRARQLRDFTADY